MLIVERHICLFPYRLVFFSYFFWSLFFFLPFFFFFFFCFFFFYIFLFKILTYFLVLTTLSCTCFFFISNLFSFVFFLVFLLLILYFINSKPILESKQLCHARAFFGFIMKFQQFDQTEQTKGE